MSNYSSTVTRDMTAPTADATTPSLRERLWAFGPTGIVVSTGLAVVEWTVVRMPESGGSVAAALLALTMIAPVALARTRPLTAAAIMLVAAVVNGLAFGDVVRCGGAFPAAVYVAFVVGAYATNGAMSGTGIARPAIGLGLVLAGLVAQWLWDPALATGPGFLFFGPPLAALAWGAGLAVHAFRTRAVRR